MASLALLLELRFVFISQLIARCCLIFDLEQPCCFKQCFPHRIHFPGRFFWGTCSNTKFRSNRTGRTNSMLYHIQRWKWAQKWQALWICKHWLCRACWIMLFAQELLELALNRDCTFLAGLQMICKCLDTANRLVNWSCRCSWLCIQWLCTEKARQVV